jgi:hypothetical protein
VTDIGGRYSIRLTGIYDEGFERMQRMERMKGRSASTVAFRVAQQSITPDPSESFDECVVVSTFNARPFAVPAVRHRSSVVHGVRPFIRFIRRIRSKPLRRCLCRSSAAARRCSVAAPPPSSERYSWTGT